MTTRREFPGTGVAGSGADPQSPIHCLVARNPFRLAAGLSGRPHPAFLRKA